MFIGEGPAPIKSVLYNLWALKKANEKTAQRAVKLK
jgi:hypothetical protein